MLMPACRAATAVSLILGWGCLGPSVSLSIHYWSTSGS